MKTVTRFEARLLEILQGFFGRAPTERIVSRVQAELPPPEGLSRNAVELVIDALQKGVPQDLAKRGGWRNDRFLNDGQIAEGRFWERRSTKNLAFRFSAASLQFLIWITAHNPASPRQPLSIESKELSTGDRYLILLAWEALRDTNLAGGLMGQPCFRSHALIWLTSLFELSETNARLPSGFDFPVWFEGQGALVLESLQTQLAESWLEIEARKFDLKDPDGLLRLGNRQDRLLNELFEAAEQADRRDLCRFFLSAMSQFCKTPDLEPGKLPVNGEHLKLAERMEVVESALVSFRQMDRLERWNREALSTGFYDEGYQAAQLWKSDWERYQGGQTVAEARSRIRTSGAMPAKQAAEGSHS